MKVISSASKIQNTCLQLKKQNKTIAVVPTMGFLHEGHLKLLRLARQKSDVLVLTLFVNPTQFSANEDLSRYPKDIQGDLQKARSCGVDLVFKPKVASLYPPGYQTDVSVTQATRFLCGASRPTHFKGVTTIVLKLFNLTQPDVAVFGKKDFQQLAVIKQMVKDLHLPIKIVAHPLVRERDGLAMSSRNSYLSTTDRQAALCLSRGLKKVRAHVLAGKTNISRLLAVLCKEITHEKRARVDYIECMHADRIEPLKKYVKGKTLFAVAVFFGKTRLIDNVVV